MKAFFVLRDRGGTYRHLSLPLTLYCLTMTADKRIIMLLSVFLMIAMGTATVVEKAAGREAVMEGVYGSWWFAGCWAALAAAVMRRIVRGGMVRQPAVLLLHGAFAVILAGALVSRFSSEHGRMHLRRGERVTYFVDSEREAHRLPFSLTLREFRTEHYHGTDVASDYVSHVTVETEAGCREMTVSMNAAGKVEGYRFCQASYDADGLGTVLLVTHDPCGTALTFAGYLSAMAGLAWVICSRRHHIRRLYQAASMPGDAAEGKETPWTAFLIILAALALTAVLARRWIEGGHVPLGNSYETMLFMAWASLVFSLSLMRKIRILKVTGPAVAFSCFAAATFVLGNPEVVPLRPVLSSPLFPAHVVTVMVSYSLLAIIFLSSLPCLFLSDEGGRCARERLTALSRLLLYPAVAFLAAGIIIGSVWASQSWGSHWSWDPKETWALLTLMVYALPLHGAAFPPQGYSRGLHLYLVLSFIVVLMTYLGVNHLLSGLHSYS